MRRNRGGSYDPGVLPDTPYASQRLDRSSYRSMVASLEDRRRFLFSRIGAPASVDRASRVFVVSGGPVSRGFSHRLNFAVPRNVSLCAKRGVRREVMFALGHGGKGGRKKTYRRNRFSDIGC